MSRQNLKAGRKVNRARDHQAAEAARRERKRLRARRARVHAAMIEARRVKRTKKRGTQDLQVNMERLGFRALDPPPPGIGSDVLRKFEPVS